jgi:hypothetical protein
LIMEWRVAEGGKRFATFVPPYLRCRANRVAK